MSDRENRAQQVFEGYALSDDSISGVWGRTWRALEHLGKDARVRVTIEPLVEPWEEAWISHTHDGLYPIEPKDAFRAGWKAKEWKARTDTDPEPDVREQFCGPFRGSFGNVGGFCTMPPGHEGEHRGY